MQRVAFRMKLFKGFEDEYKKRHDAIWDDLKILLKKAGVSDYSIFFDAETGFLFAYLNIDDIKNLDDLPKELTMQNWWRHMSDIMETNEDNSPVAVNLKEVFYLK